MKKNTQTSVTASVVLPAYNEHVYLERCLEALLAQTVPLHEIIVVDNNSTDDSIAKAKKKFPSVTFMFEKEQGIVFARNKGFDAATGDIIIKIDTDTLVEPTWNEHIIHTMIESDADGWSGHVYCDELYAPVRAITAYTFNFFVFQGMRMGAQSRPLLGCNMALRATAWDAIKDSVIMRNDIWEDLDMTLHMKAAGKKIVNSPERLARISSRSGNVPIMKCYRRFYGQPRVLLLHKKYLSYAVSFIVSQVSFLLWLIGWPILKFKQLLNTRPRLDQY